MSLLEQHFDVAFAAPDGIKKLRELILTLAMQGKLVPQDPNDEPASELLRSIETQKQRLVKEKKLKIGQLTNDSKKINKSIQIPPSWRWAKGVDLFFITKLAGFEYSKHINLQDVGEVPVIRAQNVKPFELNTDNLKYIDLKTSKILERCALTKKTLLVTFIGAGIGDVALFDLQERWHLAPNVAKMEPFEGCEEKINLNYIACFLNSQIGRDEIFKHLKSTAQPSISMGTIRDIDYPLPPLAEQRRIVAKIDQLMARCDELEKLRIDRSQRLLTVHTAALDRLLTAKDSSEFSTAWSFITQHFGELYSVKENVVELRKTILQLAVMGKLVPQESAPKVDSLQSILAESSINGVSKGPTSDTSATEVLRISAGTSQRDFYVNEDDFKHVDLSVNEIQKFQLLPGDLLACRFNGNLHYVGRFSYYRGESGRVQVNPDKLIRFRIDTDSYCPRYVCYIMNAAKTREAIEEMCATTAGNIGLSAGKLKTIKIPLPPLAEQGRIVEKIDRLMGMCDRLEESIESGKGKQTDLLNALMSQV